MNFISCNSQLRSELRNIILGLATCRHDASPQHNKCFPFHHGPSSLTYSTELLATTCCEKEHETLRNCFIEFSSFRNNLHHPSRTQSLSLFKYVTHLNFDQCFMLMGHRTAFLSLLGERQLCMCITTDQSTTTYSRLIFRSLNRAACCRCRV